MFGKRVNKLGSQGLLLDVMPTSTQAVESDDQYEVIQMLITMVNHALNVSCFLPDEILPEFLFVYQVDKYIADINNGGHGQYVGNTGINKPEMSLTTLSCRNGLAAIGAGQHVAIYDDLLALMISDQHRANKIAQAHGFGEADHAIEELDNRFFALDSKHLMALNRSWYLAQPWVEVVDGSVLDARAGELLERNKLAVARRKAAGLES